MNTAPAPAAKYGEKSQGFPGGIRQEIKFELQSRFNYISIERPGSGCLKTVVKIEVVSS